MFYPSKVEDTICDLLDPEILIAGNTDTYTEHALEIVEEYLVSLNIEYQIQCSDWQNMEGYAVSIAWIEAGHLHMMGFDCKRDDFVKGEI